MFCSDKTCIDIRSPMSLHLIDDSARWTAAEEVADKGHYDLNLLKGNFSVVAGPALARGVRIPGPAAFDLAIVLFFFATLLWVIYRTARRAVAEGASHAAAAANMLMDSYAGTSGGGGQEQGSEEEEVEAGGGGGGGCCCQQAGRWAISARWAAGGRRRQCRGRGRQWHGLSHLVIRLATPGRRPRRKRRRKRRGRACPPGRLPVHVHVNEGQDERREEGASEEERRAASEEDEEATLADLQAAAMRPAAGHAQGHRRQRVAARPNRRREGEAARARRRRAARCRSAGEGAEGTHFSWEALRLAAQCDDEEWAEVQPALLALRPPDPALRGGADGKAAKD